MARLRDLVAFARTASPFHERRYRNLPATVEDLRNLPPLTRRELMTSFDDWVTDPRITRAGLEAFLADESLLGQLYLDRYMAWRTSGTTGEPALFVQDPHAQTVYGSLWLVRGMMNWVEPHDLRAMRHAGCREAVIAVTGARFVMVAAAEGRHRSRRHLADAGRTFSLLAPRSELVEELNHFQPAFIISYPSALQMLAHEQMVGRLHVSPILVISGAETLSLAVRDSIAAVFDCPVHNVYGAAEFPSIAYDCERGWLHVNTDYVVLEAVDEDYQPTPVGCASHTVLLTNLVNRVQPIIRYDLGDSVTVKREPCACGSPLPAIRVEGRSADLLSFPTPEGGTVELLPLGLGSTIWMTPGVHRYQAIQTAPTVLRIRLELEPGSNPKEVWSSVVHRVQEHVVAQGAVPVEIERAQGPPRRHPVSGKYRKVWSEMRTANG
jgi:phenylacetate-coenzyme A ligase PaaK-like adenylate-forming protein